ncbi:MAG: signal peptide peptidase SppA [Salinisphaeraceae bacterium]|nr:signal peptide peptidase SppA [Salinisphaeraceae bacterium]
MRNRRLIILLALLPVLAGCVVVVSSPFSAFGSDPGLQETVVDGEGDAKILLLDISGFISDEPTSRALGLIQERSMLDRVAEELDTAAEDEDIRAVVLRINSPGGGVTASDEIYHRLRRYHEATGVPVIASLGSVAASGAYYLACAAQHIMAHPTSVTGSVGVIIVGVNVAGLMDKLGVANQTYTTGSHKDMLSPLRETRPEEAEIVQSVLNDLFARFKQVVRSRGDKLDEQAWPDIIDGRIFSAERARQIGLTDATGRLQDALDQARRMAGVDEARVIMYHREGAAVRTVYSRLADAPEAAHAGLPDLPLTSAPRLSPGLAATPQFLYLWQPGL